MKSINYGAIAAVRESAIVNWALKNPSIRFSPQTVCNAVYDDMYPNKNTPTELHAAFTIACMDLEHQGVLKLEKVLRRKRNTVALYSLITSEDSENDNNEV